MWKKLVCGLFILNCVLGQWDQHQDQHQDQHEQDQHQQDQNHDCPPDHHNCHVPTGQPTGVPTPAPSTPAPTFIYTVDFSNTIETKVFPSDGTTLDYYGFATSIHHHTAIVGAYAAQSNGKSVGAVYVYSTNATKFPYYDDGSTPWRYDQKLIPEHWEQKCDKEGCYWKKVDNGAAENTQFAYALGVYNDTIVVGAHQNEMRHDHGGGAYVFRKVRGHWTLKQILSPDDGHDFHYFGYSCAIYETTIMLGAAGDQHGGVGSGSVYVYDFDDDYHAWFTVAKLTSSNAQAYDNFGAAVDIYKKLAVIGAPGDSNYQGAAFAYIKFGTWVQEYKLTASDGNYKHYFGQSVSIYEDTVAIGAYQASGHWDYSGAVYVFTMQGDGSWIQQAKVIAHDGMSEDKFGFTVGLYKDTLVVGAYGEMGKQQQQEEPPKRALQGGPPENNNHDGRNGENCGPNSPPDCQKFEGEYSYRGASTGSCYVFARSGSTWLQEYKLIANGSAAYDSFGKSVAIHENVLFVGADMADGAYENTGAAYIYAPPTMSPQKSSSSGSGYLFLSGNVQFDALVALTFILVPLAAVAVYYYTQQKKSEVTQHHLPVSTDSQHGSSAPWSMHGAFDDSSRGSSSSYGRGPAPVPTRSPLRGPPVARGL